MIEFYEAGETNNFCFMENLRYQFKNWFKEDSKEQYVFQFNITNAEVTFCSKSILGIIHTMNEFFMQREVFIKEILTSQISTEQLGIQFLQPEVFHKVIRTPFDFFRTALLINKSYFTYFYIDHNKYYFSQFNKIIAKSAQIQISNHIGCNTFIGENCTIGEQVTVRDSIICEQVTLGKNTVILYSYVYNGVTIGDNCNLNNCFIMEKVDIPSGENHENLVYHKGKWSPVQIPQISQGLIWDETSYHFESDEEIQADD